ncbi:MAG: hypothetical protein K2X69_03880, partial [Silvanigrellaceae bacterium]|nr:hypothetical protein [Silvanigrellaceae bacterium]
MLNIFSKEKLLIYTTAFTLTVTASGLDNSHNLIFSDSNLTAKLNTPNSSNNYTNEKINAQLFIIEKDIIVPYLINHYLISKNELVYKFKLKNNLSHDNKKLKSKNIKRSLESFIKKNPEEFHSISGSKDFAK